MSTLLVLAVGGALLLAAVVKGGTSPVEWLLFRWRLRGLFVAAAVLVVLVSTRRRRTR